MLKFFRRKEENVSKEVLELRNIYENALNKEDRAKYIEIMEDLKKSASERETTITIDEELSNNLIKKLKDKGLIVKRKVFSEEGFDFNIWYEISFI